MLNRSLSIRGFTLIELLVVIAIIGILAAVVLASLSSSRVSAKNASVLSQAEEYHKALELYYSVNGEYPTNGHPNLTVRANSYDREYCFGEGMSTLGPNSNGDCMRNRSTSYNATYAQNVMTSLTPYISSFPTFEHAEGYASPSFSNCVTNDVPAPINRDDFCGPEYFSLYFALEGTNQDCGRATVAYAISDGNTICRLMLP